MAYKKIKSDTRSFNEKLALGNSKELLLVDILNLSLVPAKLNNESEVTDIDIELVDDDIFIDSKYCGTPFYASKKFTGLEPSNCLTISEKHVRNYNMKELLTKKKCWVSFLVEYKDFNVYEYRFFPNSYLIHLINNCSNLSDGKLRVDKNKGRTMYQFLNYIQELRKVKQDQAKR